MNSKQQDTPSVATARAEWATLDPRWLVQYLRKNTTFDADAVGEMIAFAQAAAQQDASAAQAVPADAPKGEPVGYLVDLNGREAFVAANRTAKDAHKTYGWTPLYADPIDAAAIRNAALAEAAARARSLAAGGRTLREQEAAQEIAAAIEALKTDQQEQK